MGAQTVIKTKTKLKNTETVVNFIEMLVIRCLLDAELLHICYDQELHCFNLSD